jgi:hypothetical protein
MRIFSCSTKKGGALPCILLRLSPMAFYQHECDVHSPADLTLNRRVRILWNKGTQKQIAPTVAAGASF